MCGIFALLNYSLSPPFDCIPSFIGEQFKKGSRRGPEHSTLVPIMNKTLLGFHRLAINEAANQPLIIDQIALICNGEIYNYKELYAAMSEKPKTQSDCEVILHLYRRYGIDYTLQVLDGVFAFVLIDYRYTNDESKIYVARDPYGVRPLYTLESTENEIIGFASEMKVLYGLQKDAMIQHFAPGTYSSYSFSHKAAASWTKNACVQYHQPGFPMWTNPLVDVDDNTIMKGIRVHLTRALEKRCQTTERPIACLLSGGLNSSLITALVNDYMTRHGLVPVETYSIGLEGSTDLAYARQVADYLGTRHTEIVVTEQDFLEAIPEVIQAIESYDTKTVRASVGNYLLGKYIAQHSSAKVIFNGEGYDELAGGYLYMSHAPDPLEYDKETRRLLRDIHAFDVLRSDKCISSHGLEPRTPFLDRHWVQYYLSIPAATRFAEKEWIRRAFDPSQTRNSLGQPFLPQEVLWRSRKEAFSVSLYEIIQDKSSAMIFPLREGTAHCLLQNMTHLLPQTAEQYYYRVCFEEHYRGQGHVVPYFWMPRWVECLDESNCSGLY